MAGRQPQGCRSSLPGPPGELTLHTATLVAFGSTRRAGVRAVDDEVLANLIGAGAPVACSVAKTWDRLVAEALRTSLDEAVAMVRDSVAHLRAHDLRVFLDAEHFFDGFRRNPDFTGSVLGGRGGGSRGPGAVRHQRRVPAR